MSDDRPEPCEICGPLPPPRVHSICHPGPNNPTGCGHRLDDHTDTLKCRVCHRYCAQGGGLSL